MTPTQLAALVVITLAALLAAVLFIRTWRKATLPPKPKPKEPAPAKAAPAEREWRWPQPTRKPPTLLEASRRKHPIPPRKLPASFTNRPNVKQSQVNLRKAGYREDAKIEEEPRRRHR